jgi:precorrin-6B methylase 2
MGLSRLLFKAALWKIGAKRLLERAAEARKRELLSEMRPNLGRTVLSGLFEGMLIPDETSWGHDDAFAKIAGTYELELRKVFLRAVERAPSIIINVGCAEGYYAIGLARLLPTAAVYAFDIDECARTICERSAKENGVSDRIVVGGLCTPRDLSDITSRSGRVLIIMDCEGAELELLDRVAVPGLAGSDIIVETHNFAAENAAETLQRRLDRDHDIHRISQGARGPHKLARVATLPELERWLMVSETRVEVTTWLACWANGS